MVVGKAETAVKAVKALEDREKEETAGWEVQAVVALVKVARAPEGSLAAPGVAWAGGRRRSQLRWGRHHANIRRKPMTEPGKYHTGTRAGTPDQYFAYFASRQEEGRRLVTMQMRTNAT